MAMENTVSSDFLTTFVGVERFRFPPIWCDKEKFSTKQENSTKYNSFASTECEINYVNHLKQSCKINPFMTKKTMKYIQ